MSLLLIQSSTNTALTFYLYYRNSHKTDHSLQMLGKRLYYHRAIVKYCHTTMDEGRKGYYIEGWGLPTLPGLYLSTFQPSQRGFFRVHTFM
jgi:hypothetical protein